MPISRLAVALACIVMYAMAATHWARGIHYYLLNIDNAWQLQDETVDCLSNISDGQSCNLTNDGINELLGPVTDSCSETAELLVAVSSTYY